MLALHVLLWLAIVPETRARSTSAQSGPAAEVFALVNELRAQYGVPPYQYSPELAAAAQAHTEWRVASGQMTHIGPGGTRPYHRAVAAGFGGGNEVYVSENIIGSPNLTPAQAVQRWTGDKPHLDTMVSDFYEYAGVGYVEVGNRRHYTLLAGVIANAPRYVSPAPPPGASGSAVSDSPPAPTAPPAPVRVATARPDGAIIHKVEAGQSLWTIAAVYGADLGALMAVNGFEEGAVIFPGQEVVIRSPDTPTPTVTYTPSPTFTPSLTFTPSPTDTPSLTPTASDTPRPTDTPAPTEIAQVASGADRGRRKPHAVAHGCGRRARNGAARVHRQGRAGRRAGASGLRRAGDAGRRRAGAAAALRPWRDLDTHGSPR
ncbi:MAG: CAP domain-containing protein [Anaerolineae bacterium]|nr:CAP domain-containing protein [Anaerolineae bacterium]